MDARMVGGRYRLHDTRAMGGMAAIWRATDERTGETVAVKLLHPHLAASDAARARLDREAAALGAVDHPDVVTVREVVIDDGAPAVVMDYVEGVSLAERLSAGPLPEDEALRIALDVTEALQAVHAAGLVHRDVKPGNIILGDDGRTRLIDFGIATDIDAPLDATALTAADDVIGTLRYLAPERVDGAVATPQTDLWGVGVVLFEMLTGRPAYPAATIMERASSSTELPERPAGLADPTWVVLAGAMAVDPGERPADAAELAAALHGLVGERPAPAPVGDPWADTMIHARPGAAVAAAAGAAVAPSPAAPSPAAPSPAAPSPAAPSAVASSAVVAPTPAGPVVPVVPSTRRPALLAGLAAAGLAVVVIAASFAGGGPDRAGLAEPSTAPVPAASGRAVTAPPDDADEAVDADDDRAGDEPAKGKGNGKGKGKGKGDKDD